MSKAGMIAAGSISMAIFFTLVYIVNIIPITPIENKA